MKGNRYGYLVILEGRHPFDEDWQTAAVADGFLTASTATEWAARMLGRKGADIANLAPGGESLRYFAGLPIVALRYEVSRYRLDDDCADENWSMTGRLNRRAEAEVAFRLADVLP